MKTFLFLLCSVFIITAMEADDAFARGSSSRSSSRHAKGDTHYVSKSCKTSSCYKKHPDGKYGFVMNGAKKK